MRLLTLFLFVNVFAQFLQTYTKSIQIENSLPPASAYIYITGFRGDAYGNYVRLWAIRDSLFGANYVTKDSFLFLQTNMKGIEINIGSWNGHSIMRACSAKTIGNYKYLIFYNSAGQTDTILRTQIKGLQLQDTSCDDEGISTFIYSVVGETLSLSLKCVTVGIEEGRISEGERINIPTFDRRNKFSYEVKNRQKVQVFVYDICGRIISKVMDKELEPGKYTFLWDGKDMNGNYVSSGIYFIKIKGKDFVLNKKLIIIR